MSETETEGIASDSVQTQDVASLPYMPLQDVRVSIPEGYTAGTNDTSYLDFDLHPPTLVDVQRAGLFMLTQMSKAMSALDDLRELRRKYERECAEHMLTRKELSSTSAFLDEELALEAKFREDWRAESVRASQLETQLYEANKMIAYYKEYITELESQLEGKG